ncbi:hypothetical protein F5I97DRAFT_1929963 [Phlebopus sp. FC_14]|nr:hypothetical protein F5I97DRAFT_1929963 [Phlebopus sp. FC_14]
MPPATKQAHSTTLGTQNICTFSRPTTNGVARARKSARLARRIHSRINPCNPDIYEHLADPSGSGALLSEPFGPSTNVSSASLLAALTSDKKKPKGPPKRPLDLGDDGTRIALMEEWARIRMSQGMLPGASELVQVMQTSPSSHNHPEGRGATPLSSGPEVACQGNSRMQTWHSQNFCVGNPRQYLDLSSHESDTTLHPGDSHANSPTNIVYSEPQTSTEGSQHLEPQFVIDRSAISEEEVVLLTAEQPLVLGERAQLSAAPSDFAAHNGCMSDAGGPPTKKEDVGADRPAPSGSVIYPQLNGSDHSFQRNGNGDMNFDAEFHMLDLHDILTLPWEPLTSQIYVPPSLGQLIAGMKRQLVAEARARRNAEAQYEEELQAEGYHPPTLLAYGPAVRCVTSQTDIV